MDTKYNVEVELTKQRREIARELFLVVGSPIAIQSDCESGLVVHESEVEHGQGVF